MELNVSEFLDILLDTYFKKDESLMPIDEKILAMARSYLFLGREVTKMYRISRALKTTNEPNERSAQIDELLKLISSAFSKRKPNYKEI